MASNLLSIPTINVGDVVSYAKVSYSVVYIDAGKNNVVLFEQNVAKRRGFQTALSDLIDEIRIGKAYVNKGNHSYVPADDKNPIYKTRLAIIHEIEAVFGPTYLNLLGKRSKPELQEIENKLHVGHTLVCKTINLYLSNGCDETALYPKQNKSRPLDPDKEYARRGAKAKEADLQSEIIVTNNPEIIEIFKKYRKRILGSFFFTITAAYEDMIGKYFLRVVPYTDQDGVKQLSYSLLPCDIPTFRQFYYWFMNNTTYEERISAKKGVWNFRNNYRVLFGDSYSNAYGPGYLTEIDHWEVPVYLKSLFSNDTVSKSTLTVLMDNYMGAPITLNLSFDNNKNRAVTSVLLTLNKNKKELCADYGINISESDWPSCYFPNIVRVDGGPDFTSHNTVRVMGENKFELQIVPPGMGSYKPNVERFFGTLNTYLASLLEGKGYITKQPNSHPEKEACLTIDDLFRIILEFTVMYYRSRRMNYKASKEMLQNSIEITPLGLYKFGARKYGAPKPIINEDSFLWSLLMDDIPVYISTNGLSFNKTLEYSDRKNKKLYNMIQECGKQHKPFPARYDPRDIGQIYYLDQGRLIPVPLKTAYSSFAGLTLYEYDCYHEIENRDKRYGKFQNLQKKVVVRQSAVQNIKSAELAQGFMPGTQFMRENTSIEREAVARRSAISKEIHSNSEDVPCIEGGSNSCSSIETNIPQYPALLNDPQGTVQSMINLRKTINKSRT